MWDKGKLLEILNRRKTLQEDILETPLKRCLTTTDLTLLGIGHMIGAGIFVLTGTVVKNIAGPGTVLSYLLAGVAAMLSSLCYAEFGARVPKAGSAYTYSYVTMGEFWAFIIGWNIILEHLLGVASVARAWSGSFDALFNGAIKNGTLTHLGSMQIPWLSEYPDFIALLVVLLVIVFVALGTKLSANFNSVFTGVNMLVILLIISVGFSLGEGKNWSDMKQGGFLPFGGPGVFAGAATCFYAYIGFEGIAVAGEEAQNPSKSIPIATGLAMVIVTTLYVGSSASLTLMIPYFDVDVAAPFPAAFEQRGMHWARFFVAIGTMFGITTSLIGGLFSLPRAAYSMASDGLLFRFFAIVHPKTQTPIAAIISLGFVAGLLAFFVDIETLVEFLSIGTLLSFTMVAACILILHYRPADKLQFKLRTEENGEEDEEAQDPCTSGDTSDKKRILQTSQSHDDIGKLRKKYEKLPLIKDLSPGHATVTAVILMAVFMAAFWMMLLLGWQYVRVAEWWSIILLIFFACGIVGCLLILLVHEQNKSFLTFQVGGPAIIYGCCLHRFACHVSVQFFGM